MLSVNRALNFGYYFIMLTTEVVDLPSATEVEAKLRTTLGEYNKKRLKKEHYPIEKVPDDISRAAGWMQRQVVAILQGQIPAGFIYSGRQLLTKLFRPNCLLLWPV